MARLTNLQWAEVKADYEVKNLSNRELAAIHGVSESGIRKKAEQDSWVKGGSAHLISMNYNVIKEVSEIGAQSAQLSAQHLIAISDEVSFRLQNDDDLQAIQNVVNKMAKSVEIAPHALALMTATIKHRDARLGKSPETAIQINNVNGMGCKIQEMTDDELYTIAGR